MAGGERTEVETTLLSGESGGGPVLPLGARIGRFTVLEPLGAGGMGIVVAAHDPQLDRRVALKLVRGDAVRARGRDRLLREGQAMAKLSHPNVLTVYEAGTVSEDIFLVMELVEGRTLREWLAPGRTWQEVLDVFVAIGRGLAAAHRAGLVHRDFKPDNVLIGDDGRARVMDFGLVTAGGASEPTPGETSSSGGDLTRTGSIMGTPIYMSPEQHLGGDVDARADQWAFCVSLYEALWGMAPFPGKTIEELRDAVLDGRIREPSDRVGVPARLRKIVLRGLQREPGDRHASLDAVVADLAEIPVQRRRVAFGTAVLGIATAAGALAFALARSDGEPDRCANVAAPLETVWNDEARETLRASLAAVPRGGSTAERVIAILDGRADAWRKMRIETCVATRDGAQSEPVLDLRMRCLDERLGQLSALLGALSTGADATTLERAVDAATGAMPLERCADEKRLAAAYPDPEDPASRAVVDGLRQRLDVVEALARTGRTADAHAQLVPLLEEIRKNGHPPLLAAALHELGAIQSTLGDAAAAEAAFREGVQAAARAREAWRELELWTMLIAAVSRAGRPEDALELVEPARAALARFDDAPGPKAALLLNEASVYTNTGRYVEARKLLDEALAIQRGVLPAQHADLIPVITAIGQIERQLGQLEESTEHYREALAIAELQYGHDHPETIDVLGKLATNMEIEGDVAEARATLEDMLRRSESAHGSDVMTTALVRANLATLVIRADVAAGRALFEEAIADLEKAGAVVSHANISINFCSHWLGDGRDDTRVTDAEAICGRAHDAAVAAFGAESPKVALVKTLQGQVFHIQGKFTEGEAVLRAALAQLVEHQGEDHPYVLMTIAGLSRSLAAQRRFDEALPFAEQGVERLRKAAPNPIWLFDATFVLGQIEWDAGKKQKGIAHVKEAHRLATEYGGLEAMREEIVGWLAARGEKP